jgi:predicted membrane protein
MNGPQVVGKDSGSGRLTPQLLFGLLVTIVGVLFTLDNLGIADAGRYARYWPVGLIAVGLVKLWQSRDGQGGAFAGLIFTMGGAWLLLEAMTVIRISFFDLWPLLLVFFGTYLVWQGFAERPQPVVGAGTEAGNAAASQARISAAAVLGAVVRGSNSTEFRGGDLTAIMGSCEIDLRRATINGEAVVDVFAMWGGIEIRVPDDWTVDSRIVPLLGGVEDKTRPPQGVTANRLTLRGIALMGGVEIKN